MATNITNSYPNYTVDEDWVISSSTLKSDQLRFPDNIDDTHNIIISIKEKDIQGLSSTELNTFQSDFNAPSQSGENIIDSIQNITQDKASAVKKLISNVSISSTNTVCDIILPIPINLNVNYNAGWSGESINLFDYFLREGIESLGNGESTVNNISEISKKISTRWLSDFARGVTGFTGKGAYVAFNPYKELMYSSPSFRKFSFQWVLSPRNEKESNTLREILFNLKKYMHPKELDFEAVWLYPSFVDINFNVKDRNENTFLFKILSSAIENISIEYDNKFHNDGSPVVYRLTIDFLESELLTQSNFKDPKNSF